MNAPNKYIENIKQLDFQVENQDSSSVFLVQKLDTYVQEGKISPHIIFALDKAKQFHVDAVYFRFFEDNRPPLAQIYIYDNIINTRNELNYAELHRAIWSSCEISTFLIVDETTIRVYDSREPVSIKNEEIKSFPIKTLDLSFTNQVLKEYNAELFNNGSFWERPENKQHFLYNKVASERLIAGLKKVRENLQKNSGLSNQLIDKLLIICILIKYLEENGVDKESHQNLAHHFFKEATGYSTLEEIIRNNQLVCLLNSLAKHFNGGIFSLDEYWLAEITKADISPLAFFFEAGYQNNLFGWKEYSFEHIPVELISNFYEEFIPQNNLLEESSRQSTGAVYTPSFLVNLLIDECLPLKYENDALNENIKLIDPTCGSGIFLVTAYKRLVQRWRLKNSKDGKLANTNPKILKEILSKNIYGVDANQNSVNLSIFSLQLAVCSMLTPKQIWVDFGHLDNLEGKNIVHQDFFKYLINLKKNDFDLVIGNPPFKRNKLGGKTINYYTNILKEKHPVKFKNEEKEFALLFLEKSAHLLKKESGKLCLIMPSGPLLYLGKSSIDYRKGLFSTYKISQIIDFTYLRRILFSATIPTLAIFLETSKPKEDDTILHIVGKRTKTSKEKAYFEFDHYDFYNVPLSYVTNLPNVWKCNLIGGDMVYNIVSKIKKQTPVLRNFYKEEKIICKSSVSKIDFMRFSISNNVKENQQRSLFHEELFCDERDKNDSDASIWAIRKKITKGKFPEEVLLSNFKNNFFDGISYLGNKNSLLKLKDYFIKNSNIMSFYIAATSTRQGVRSPYVINSEDIHEFPYINNWNDILTEEDRFIIEDVGKYILDEFGNGEKAIINKDLATISDLKKFSSVYCNILNKVYQESDNRKYTLTSITEGNAYYICEYVFTGNESTVEELFNEDNLDTILSSWNYSRSKKINRVFRVYTPNIIKLIKPKQLRYWLKSKALRDADETFRDIIS
jgi:type I restriction-modification system DNA methylase subunit